MELSLYMDRQELEKLLLWWAVRMIEIMNLMLLIKNNSRVGRVYLEICMKIVEYLFLLFKIYFWKFKIKLKTLILKLN